jgi:hypothetical protein
MTSLPDVSPLLHFLLYTGEGSLLMVLAASAFIAVAGWWALNLVVALLAFAVWLLLHVRARTRGPAPGCVRRLIGRREAHPSVVV